LSAERLAAQVEPLSYHCAQQQAADDRERNRRHRAGKIVEMHDRLDDVMRLDQPGNSEERKYAQARVRGRVSAMRLVTFLVLLALVVWILRPQYLKWQQRRRFREFEDEARRKWERHKRE
jgi:hypothetical protein